MVVVRTYSMFQAPFQEPSHSFGPGWESLTETKIINFFKKFPVYDKRQQNGTVFFGAGFSFVTRVHEVSVLSIYVLVNTI